MVKKEVKKKNQAMIGVTPDTRDKLKEKAGDVPLSRFLKRIAEDKGDKTAQNTRQMSRFIALIASMWVGIPATKGNVTEYLAVVESLAGEIDQLENMTAAQFAQLTQKAGLILRQAKMPEFEIAEDSVTESV